VYRDPEENAAVGGHPRSQHLLGLAGDWVVEPADRPRFLQTAAFLGLVAVEEASHVHVQRYEAGLIPGAVFET
jgi:hypothetical protein